MTQMMTYCSPATLVIAPAISAMRVVTRMFPLASCRGRFLRRNGKLGNVTSSNMISQRKTVLPPVLQGPGRVVQPLTVRPDGDYVVPEA